MRKEEEYAIVLDFLPNGIAEKNIFEPVAIVVGKDYFTLLQVTPKKNVLLKPGDVVYIGKGTREHIERIVARLRYKELTKAAKEVLPKVVEKLVKKNENKYVEFFNKASPITSRLHQLELIPGIGKKYLWKILEEREKKPFENFNEIKERCNLIIDPKKAVIKRILEEIEGKDKYHLFT